MKTAAEWFNELPPEVREKALKNCQILDDECENLDEALMGSFSWMDSPEGLSFWIDVHNTYC